MARIGIIIYSLYHHIATMAEEVKKGIESTGNEAVIYQVPETLSEEALTAMGAPPRPDYPIATPETLTTLDGIIFGIPTRFGSLPAQMKAFIDATGGLWASGALYQKFCGVFTSTGGGGGNEFTIYSTLSTLVHHGMIFVPLGYAKAFGEITTLTQDNTSTAWGAATLAGSDGSRKPTELDLKIANIQGQEFATVVSNFLENSDSKVVKKSITETKSVKKEIEKTAKNGKYEIKNSVKNSVPKEEPKKKNLISRIFSKLFN